MGKNTTFIKHTGCEACGSSDANAVYSDGSATCFSCKKYTPAGGIQVEDTEIQFNVIQTKLDLEQIEQLPTDTFRGISKATNYDSGVKVEYDQNRNIISHYYPITVAGKIKAYKKRIVSTKEFRVIGKVEVPELFNQVNSGRRKNLVITEGEVDALSIIEMLKTAKAQLDVVSIVNGAQSARRNVAANLDFVNKYQKVFIAFDQDKQGVDAAKEVAHILKPGIGHIVDCSHVKDANQALEMNISDKYMQCIWSAKAYRPDSFISGEGIWKAYKERSKIKSVPYPACLKGLNDKVMGMRLGEILLLTSGTGVGKSSIIKELILNLLGETEDKVGLVSLEESIADSASKLIGMAVKKNIKMPGDITDEEARKGFDIVFKDERLIMLDHLGSVSDGNLIDRMEYLAAVGCKWLILDHVTIAISENPAGLGSNENMDKFMSDLLKLTKRYNIGLILVSHLRKSGGDMKSFESGRVPSLDDLKGSGALKQIAFDVVGFSRNLLEENIDERNKVSFYVLKSRFAGNTGKAGYAKYNQDTGRLEYTEDNLAFKEI